MSDDRHIDSLDKSRDALRSDSPEHLESLLGELADEFGRRCDAGERPTIDEYVARFPHLADVLPEVLRTVLVMNDMSHREIEPASGAMHELPGLPLTEPLGDFRIVREIGRGGMGIVYEAEQRSLGRRIALKVLPLFGMLDEQRLRRFKNEAHAAAMLQHPHIVSVFYVGCERGVNFYAMPLIEGRNLQEIIGHARGSITGSGVFFRDFGSGSEPAPEITKKDSRPPSAPIAHDASTNPIAHLDTILSSPGRERTREIAALGIQAAQALDYAHREGVIHRDIKPSNLLIDKDGKLWITDFGLARIQGQGSTAPGGQGVGTLRYMSPEQLSAERVVDHRTDIYSLGLTLYELATLRPAFADTDRPLLMRQILEHEPTPIRQIDSTIPPDLATIIERAISKEREHRYQSAQALADDLQRFLDQRPIMARPISRIGRVWRWYKRSPVVAALSMGVMLLSLLLATTASVLAMREARQREREVEQRQAAEADARESRWQRYVSDMHSAMAAWEDSNMGRAVELLERHLPQPGQEDHRGFEWSYLRHKCEEGRAELSIAHPSIVRSVAVSPDGKTIATSADDHVVRLWDSQTGTLKATWFPDASRIDDVAYSPLGHDLAAASREGTIHIWDVDRRRERLCLSGHMDGVLFLCYARDGSRLYSSGWDNTVRTWDAGTGTLLKTIHLRAQPIATAAVNQLWTYCPAQSNQIRLLDTLTGDVLRQFQRFELQNTFIARVGISASRQLGISGGHDGVVRFFRLTDGGDIYSEAAHRRLANSAISLSADERYCATADIDGRMVVWDLDSPSVHATFRGHTGQIRQTAWLPDGRRVASAGADGWLKVWSIDNQPRQDVFRGHTGNVLAVAFHPSGNWLITSGEKSSELFVWDVTTGQRAAELSAGHKDQVAGLAFSPDGRELASVSYDGTMRLWDFERRKFVRAIRVSQSELYSVAYSRDGREIVASDEDGWLHIYPRGADQPRLRLRLGSSGSESLAFSPDGRRLAAAVDGTVVHVDYPACQRVDRFPSLLKWTETIDFSPDGTQIACAGRDNAEIIIYSFDGTAPVRLQSPDGIQGLDISPDGRTLAAAGNDLHIHLWDLAHREIRAVLRGHTRWVSDLRFSPDGTALASASDDKTARMWRTVPHSTGVEINADSLRTVRPPTAETVDALKVSNRWSPQSGQRAAGVDPLQARLAQFPDDQFTAYQLAILQLHLGRLTEHQELVRGILDYFEKSMGSTRLSSKGERIAIVCLLDDKLAREHATRLRPLLMQTNVARKAETDSSEASNLHDWGLLSLGWTEYRLDDNKAAIAAFKELLSRDVADPILNAMAQFGLAGAHRAEGELQAAAQAEATAQERLEEYRRWISSQQGDVPYAWQDGLMCEIVQIEVKN